MFFPILSSDILGLIAILKKISNHYFIVLWKEIVDNLQ